MTVVCVECGATLTGLRATSRSKLCLDCTGRDEDWQREEQERATWWPDLEPDRDEGSMAEREQERLAENAR